jgi:hypothetical protein
MGGFLLIKKSGRLDLAGGNQLYGSSLRVFEKKGLPLSQAIIRDDFVLYVFHKHQIREDNVALLDADQFISVTGTCLYNGKTGRTALIEMFQDFLVNPDFFDNICGQYCLIIFKNSRLYIFNDQVGVYHIYGDESMTVLSSSFLAICKALEGSKTVSAQELYEYIFYSMFFGNQTYVKQINLLDSKAIWQLSPAVSPIPKPAIAELPEMATFFDEMIGKVAASLIDYFAALRVNFGDSICAALSGGFDSRLMLAAMRKVGIKPYLYVYGSDDSIDVRISKAVGQGEGLAIEHESSQNFPRVLPDQFAGLLEEQYYFRDGIGHEHGVFDSGWGREVRLKRAAKARLQLNGTGGEIFRNFWVLPDKVFNINSFIKSYYDRIDYSFCRNQFSKRLFFHLLVDKIKSLLDCEKNQIDRWQIEKLYPLLRMKCWLGNQQTINNQLAYALTPYIEPRFISQSLSIPLRFKQSGLFEAALIRFIDPVIAQYPSVYGFTFADKVTALRKVRDYIKVNTPVFLRPLMRRRLWNAGTVSLRLGRGKKEFPFYLGEDYLREIFPSKDLFVSKYVDLNRVTDAEMLSRILSAELVLNDRF